LLILTPAEVTLQIYTLRRILTYFTWSNSSTELIIVYTSVVMYVGRVRHVTFYAIKYGFCSIACHYMNNNHLSVCCAIGVRRIVGSFAWLVYWPDRATSTTAEGQSPLTKNDAR
jgi:hypothetical protein